MDHPRIGQRVWADRLTGTFTFIRTDREQGVAVADLELAAGQIYARIPFSALHAVGEDLTQTVGWKIHRTD
jgi:hypothetical protein